MAEEQNKLISDQVNKTSIITRMIKDVPCYDGNPSGLHNFISQMADFIEMAKPENTVYPETIVRAIRNRVIGKASDALDLYGTPNTWEGIQRDLTSHFADKRDESSLIQELHNISQGNDKVEDYFAKLSSILGALKNWAKINELGSFVLKSQWYDRMALSIFTNKLREPLGSHVRSMQPTTLIDARTICIREQSLSTLRYSNKPLFNIKPPIIPPRNNFGNFSSTPQRFQSYQTPQYRPQNNLPPKPNFGHNNNNFNKGPNPYYNHRPFVNTNKPIMGKPEPMDTTTNTNKFRQITYGQQQQRAPFQAQYPNRFQPTGPPRYQVEELHCNEYNEENNYIPEGYYPQEYESEPIYEETQQENSEPTVEIEEDQDFHLTTLKMPDT